MGGWFVDRRRGLPRWKFLHCPPPEDLDLHHATFAAPDQTTFCRLDELGLEAVGQRLEPDRAVIECRRAPGEVSRGGIGNPD